MANLFSAKSSQPWGKAFGRGIKFVSKCPICQSRYKDDQANIIEQKADAHLVHIECQNCHGNVVALIVQAGMGLNSFALVTDLTAKDVLKFKDKQAITENDCIQIHQLIERI